MTDSKCRFCLEDIDPDDCGSSLFDKRLRLAMAGVFSFEIPFRRDLPMHTCKRCSWNVMDFHDYCETVEKNQEKLKQDFLLDDEFETDEDLPMEISDSDDVKEEAAPIECEAQYSIKSEYYADSNIHLSPVAITPTIVDSEDDDAADDIKVAYEFHPDFASADIKVAYEFHPDFASADCEETCDNGGQLSVENEDHKITSHSEEKVEKLESEENNPINISVNASVSTEVVHDRTIDPPASEQKESCSRRSSRIAHRVLERKPKSVGARSHAQRGESPQQRSVGKKGVKRRPSTRTARGFHCNACDKSFFSKLNLKFHVDVHHAAETVGTEQDRTEQSSQNRKKHACDQCGKLFLSKKLLREHYRYHKLVKCLVCKKTVNEKKLKEHIAAHEGAFRCDVCGRMYATKRCLQIHKVDLHPTDKAGGAKYCCDQCEKPFFFKQQLFKHKLDHKLFRCPVCKKSLSRRRFRAHIAAHEGAFCCEVCEKLFPSKCDLEKHQCTQRHTLEADGMQRP